LKKDFPAWIGPASGPDGKRAYGGQFVAQSLAAARRTMLGTRDAHGLYAQFGFRAPPDDGVLMQILRPDMYRVAATA